MPQLWLALLGTLLAGYLVLDGYTFGVGLVRLRLGHGDRERRLLLNAVGPYFLGNEVWIVATAGVLFGGFPDLEGSLLAAFYPLIVLVIGSLLVRDGGMWFRSRRESSRWRDTWDRIIAGASAALPVGWGLILGNLVRGVPHGRAAPIGAALFSPYALLCGATLALLAACHGAAFIALRTEGPLAGRGAQLARRLTGPAGAALAAAAGFGFLAGRMDQPAAAAAIALAALVPLLAARYFLGTGRYAMGFAATAMSVALPVVAVGTGQALKLQSLVAAAGTRSLLGAFLVAVLPAMALSQIWLWRAFRGRVGPASPQYF
jgi:cytochrome bd ubiquinol oxidase subunit II